jgi:hypothetical protein
MKPLPRNEVSEEEIAQRLQSIFQVAKEEIVDLGLDSPHWLHWEECSKDVKGAFLLFAKLLLTKFMIYERPNEDDRNKENPLNGI